MLSQLVQSAGWLFIPLLFIGLSRTRWWVPASVFVLLFMIGLNRESLLVSDIWMLPSYTNLWDNCLIIFLWVLVGLLWSEAFPVKKIYSPRVTAFLIGLCFGEIALPFLVSKAVSDKKERGSALFAGVGGAVLLPFGDLGHFGFGVKQEYWYILILISIISVLFSGKSIIEWKEQENATALPYFLGILIVVSVSIASPTSQMMILGVVAFGLSVVNKAFLRISHSLLGVVGFAFCAIMITTAGGAPELIAWALEDSQFTYATYLNVVLLVCFSLASGLIGEWNVVLFGQALQERALDIHKEELWTMMALGTSIGGVSSFILAKSWRENWKRVLSLFFVLLLILSILV